MSRCDNLGKMNVQGAEEIALERFKNMVNIVTFCDSTSLVRKSGAVALPEQFQWHTGCRFQTELVET